MPDLRPSPSGPDPFRFLVSAYHPETLRSPAAGPIATPSERLRSALTWNVFKTLEQIAPGVWMRRLIAMSAGLPEGYDSAPHVTAVTCWSHLNPAPSAVLRRGRRSLVPVSAMVDTDDTVIVLLTPALTDLPEAVTESKDGGLLELAEAAAWFAGARSAYVIVVVPIDADDESWIPRVRQRADRVRRVLHAGPKGPANLRGIGATTWRDLHGLLSEVSASRFITESERRWATTTVEWMAARLGPSAIPLRLAGQ